MIACNATAATIRRPCGRQSSDSLSRIATTTPVNGLRLVRVGSVVQASVNVNMIYPKGAVKVSDIPEGYRPEWPCYRDVGCGYGYAIRFNISNTAINAYNYNNSETNNVSGGFTYITADPFPAE